jgi:hypothetical protein
MIYLFLDFFDGQGGGYSLCKTAKRPAPGAVWKILDICLAIFTTFQQVGIHRQGSPIRNAIGLGHFLGSSSRRGMNLGRDDRLQNFRARFFQFGQHGLGTIRSILLGKLQLFQTRDILSHIFNHSQNGYFSLLTKIQFFADIGHGYFFGGRDDHRATDGSRLFQILDRRNVFVARSRRGIDNQVIQTVRVARPIDFGQKLLNESIFAGACSSGNKQNETERLEQSMVAKLCWKISTVVSLLNLT